MRFKFGSLGQILKCAPLTGDRTIFLPDKSGYLAGLEQATTFSSAVRLNGFTRYGTTPTAITGPLTITVDPTSQICGGSAVLKLVSNGVNVPTFGSGMKQKSTSMGWDGRNGITNTVSMFFDGTDVWYEVWQELGALPAMLPIALTFPNRVGPTINQTGQTYSSTGTVNNGFTSTHMSSAQAIPQGRAGRLVVRSRGCLVALCDTNVAESFNTNNYEYFAWFAPPNTWTGTGATLTNSGAPGAESDYLRLTRSNTGVVTVEHSTASSGPWALVRTFGNTTLVPLFVTASFNDGVSGNFLEVVSFEVES